MVKETGSVIHKVEHGWIDLNECDSRLYWGTQHCKCTVKVICYASELGHKFSSDYIWRAVVLLLFDQCSITAHVISKPKL